MRLRANAVELVFYKELARHRAFNISEVRGRRRQHKFQRMKQAHLDSLQGAGARAHRGLADISAQHVGHRN